MHTDMNRYAELESTYKIRHNTHGLLTNAERKALSPSARRRAELKAMEPYDIVVEPCGYGFANHKFRILKNGPLLESRDLALICGRGDLRGGYGIEESVISLYNKEVLDEPEEIQGIAT